MYRKEKPFRHENPKPKKTHRNIPSFSSTLLDEICRSIDRNGEIQENSDGDRETPASVLQPKSSTGGVRDEEMARFPRACLVEKWMEKGVSGRNAAKKLANSLFQDNDLPFFGSTTSSSDSSGALSSSDTEFFGSATRSKASCSVKRPKPVRTGVSRRENNSQEDFFLFDDYQNYEKRKVEDDLIKSRSRALKIYANLKKLKQPISPGAKLTSLINSFFAGMNRKKSKNVDRNTGFREQNSPDQSSSSSSTHSFSRSCMIKDSQKSSERMREGVQRTVRFHHVGAIVDQESKPCGKKSIYNEGYDKCGRPPLPPNAMKAQDQRKSDFSTFRKIRDEEDDDEDEDDAFSDSSSDLFELDHLSLLGDNDRFCEELPVYETTYFDKNRGLIL